MKSKTPLTKVEQSKSPGLFGRIKESFQGWANIGGYFNRAAETPPRDKKRNTRPSMKPTRA